MAHTTCKESALVSVCVCVCVCVCVSAMTFVRMAVTKRTMLVNGESHFKSLQNLQCESDNNILMYNHESLGQIIIPSELFNFEKSKFRYKSKVTFDIIFRKKTNL